MKNIFWEKSENPIPPEVFFSMEYMLENACEIKHPMKIKTQRDVDEWVKEMERILHTLK